jgi:hypothetical protein
MPKGLPLGFIYGEKPSLFIMLRNVLNIVIIDIE